MKTAKPPSASEAAPTSSRRSQPVRQTRTNPPRASSGLNRPNLNSLAAVAAQDQPIDIFPGVTHFADAITALPKELVRHFTLLKEVDAKIFAPEQALFQLIDAALKAPPPEPARSLNDASSSVAHMSTPMSAQNSGSGVFPIARVSSTDEPVNPAVFDPSNLPRRQLFRQTAFKIQEMLVSLEEKNHVISTANEALQKQLARIDDIWPHLESEFSDEAKWGSTAHWAYLENRLAKANNNQDERSRRAVAATLSAAAQQLADEAAARSETRKQAVAAKKNSRNQQPPESDLETKPPEQHKKTQGASKPKAPKATTDSPAPVGLGISTTAPVNGNPEKKRRKVEKPANGAASAERAISAVLGPNAPKPKTASPRETPAPDGASKKRKALPTSGSQAKKRLVDHKSQKWSSLTKYTSSRTGAAMSPSVTSSPVIPTFPDPAKPGRSSPAPSNTVRPNSSRARQNSIHSTLENGRQRPSSSSASNRPNGLLPGTPDLSVQNNGAKAATEVKAPKESHSAPKADIQKVENDNQALPLPPPPPPPPSVNGSKKEATAKGAEEVETKESATPVIAPPPTPTVTTKSGRASKPSTPALATFAEAATAARARPSRAGEGTGTTAKRSHKKGASAAAAAVQAMAAAAAAASATGRDTGGNAQEEDDAEIDGDEPRYCYCNGVSYGEMVACDADGCEREWFHLECVGLRVAPKGNGESNILIRVLVDDVRLTRS